MKKTIQILVIICVSICANFSFSQENADDYNRSFKLGFGLNGGVPFNDPYSFNAGADVRFQYNISETYSICFTTGYNNLFVKDNGVDLGYIPVKIGYKTFIFSNEFYVMGEIGAVFSVTKEYDDNSMLFGPSIGYATKYVDISLRYEFLKDFPIIKDNIADNGLAQLMVRLAYGFDL